MCDVLDKVEQRGEKRGRDKAEAEINERVAVDMLKDGKPVQEIEKYSHLSNHTIMKLAKSLGVQLVTL